MNLWYTFAPSPRRAQIFGNCFETHPEGHRDDVTQPDERWSGFFVGQADLQSEALIWQETGKRSRRNIPYKGKR
jgi:hypothetical protein